MRDKTLAEAIRRQGRERPDATAYIAPRRTWTFGDIDAESNRVAQGLARLGVGPGDRVATFAWNTQEHLELYLAVPCIGAVLHTVNIRLFEEDLEYIFNHAEDRVVFVDASLVDRLVPLAHRLTSPLRFVFLGDEDNTEGPLPDAVGYAELLAAPPPECA